MKLHLAWPVSVAAAALVLAGCSSSDAGSTEESSASSSAETTTSAAAAPSPELQKAADDYKAYAVAQADELVKVVKVFTDAVRAGDLKAAQDAFAPSRQPWERIEPIAGLVEDIDGKTDSRVDDFANVDDPAFTGWHRLEYLLFEKNTTEGGAPFADQLDADIANAAEAAAERRGQAASTSPTAPPSSSKRSPRARSPARRTATPRPTCGTSTPTCRARRSRSTS